MQAAGNFIDDAAAGPDLLRQEDWGVRHMLSPQAQRFEQLAQHLVLQELLLAVRHERSSISFLTAKTFREKRRVAGGL
jgi:hypothetical protein